jgi:uncharacterized protein (DUF849 family)
MSTRPILVAVAPNGARRTPSDHAALPMTAADLARTAAACAEAGAAMIHLHVRNAAGEHVLDADLYRQAIAAIRAAVGERMVIQVTTESAGRYFREKQMALVRDVRPEAVSLALREMCPAEDTVPDFAAFLAWLATERIAVQHILYDPADVSRLAALVERGVIPDIQPVQSLCVLGRYGARDAKPADLLPFLAAGAERFGRFMVCAFGPAEAGCVVAGALLGGDVRVGFENNLWLPDGELAPDNAALVAAVVDSLGRLGLAPAQADDARK